MNIQPQQKSCPGKDTVLDEGRRVLPKRRRAATAVEFAMVAPILFLIILGMIELGRGIMVQTLLTNAARAGVRVGIVEGKSNTDITAAVNSTLTTGGISSGTTSVLINDVTGDAANAQPQDEVTVIVSVPVNQVTWVPVPMYLNGSISGQYTMRRE